MDKRQERMVRSWKIFSPLLVIIGIGLIIFPLFVWISLQSNPKETLRKIYKPLVSIEQGIARDKEAFNSIKAQMKTDNEKFLWDQSMRYSDALLSEYYLNTIGNLKSIMTLLQVSGLILAAWGITTNKLLRIIEKK